MILAILRSPQVALAVAVLALTANEGRAQGGKIAKVEFDQANLEEVIEYFRSGGGSGGKSRNILVDPRLDQTTTITLTLHDVSRGAAFAYAAELAGFDYRDDGNVLRIFPRRGKPAVKSFLKRGRATTIRRASEIQLPKVDYDATELGDVVSELAATSRQLDPKKKGLNIILGRGVDRSTPVTLNLQNLPALSVVKYVAGFARLDMRVDGPAIVLTPRRKVEVRQ